ncbi:MAG TPA: hypothetical protein VGB83_09325 [Actinomycetota bacterium]
MAVEKMSLSFPKSLARTIRREAKRAGMTASAWVARAVEQEARFAAQREAIEDYEAEHGEITEEDLERVRRWYEEG